MDEKNLEGSAKQPDITPSTTFVRLFNPQFAPLVRSGSKRQTIQAIPKRMPRQNDMIDCREWTGKPYRSKQQKLLEPQLILAVRQVTIFTRGIHVGGHPLNSSQREVFAKLDGFESYDEMRDWFESVHGLPFDGILIQW